MKNLIVLVVLVMLSLNNFAGGKLNPVFKYTSPSLEEIKKFAEGTSVASVSYREFLISVVKSKVGYDVSLDYIFSHLTKQSIPDTLKAFTYGNSGVDPVTQKMVPCGGHKNLTEAWVFNDRNISFPLIKVDCANVLSCTPTFSQAPIVPAPPVNNPQIIYIHDTVYIPSPTTTTRVECVPQDEKLGHIEPHYSVSYPRTCFTGADFRPNCEDKTTLQNEEPNYQTKDPVDVDCETTNRPPYSGNNSDVTPDRTSSSGNNTTVYRTQPNNNRNTTVYRTQPNNKREQRRTKI
jgi:hypothetical protein